MQHIFLEIGDTSDLYAKILGHSSDRHLQNSNLKEKTHVETAKASSHNEIDSYVCINNIIAKSVNTNYKMLCLKCM